MSLLFPTYGAIQLLALWALWTEVLPDSLSLWPIKLAPVDNPVSLLLCTLSVSQ